LFTRNTLPVDTTLPFRANTIITRWNTVPVLTNKSGRTVNRNAIPVRTVVAWAVKSNTIFNPKTFRFFYAVSVWVKKISFATLTLTFFITALVRFGTVGVVVAFRTFIERWVTNSVRAGFSHTLSTNTRIARGTGIVSIALHTTSVESRKESCGAGA